MNRIFFLAFAFISFDSFAAAAPPALPVVEDVEWEPLRKHCRELLAEDSALHSATSETTVTLRRLLSQKPDDPKIAIRNVQRLLDPHCLVGVHINAESRVHAERGPAKALLRLDKPSLFLIKVHNDGGVTHPLRLRDFGSEGGWLRGDLTPVTELSGRRLEYRLLRLTPRETGKREATLQFDVGQGTQDLGFRAEVPILFTISTGRSDE